MSAQPGLPDFCYIAGTGYSYVAVLHTIMMLWIKPIGQSTNPASNMGDPTLVILFCEM